MCKFSLKSGDTRIDPCMKSLIKALNEHGIVTLACCCGHGKYPMTIVYKVTKGVLTGNIYDFISGWGIPRKKKFYKRDKQGHYYIPEVLEENNGKH